MGQTRIESIVETVIGTLIGMMVSLTLQFIVFPLYGFDAPPIVHLWILFWFTLASLVRGYWVRRLFNARSWKNLFVETTA